MITFIAALLGGVIYRLRGWGPADPNIQYWWKRRPILQMAFALPYAFALMGYSWWVALLVLAVTTVSVITGHASYIDLGGVKTGALNMPADGQSNEWYGTWIPGSGYWRDFAGLVVSGMLITAPCGLALIWAGHWTSGAAIVASGALKAVAYAIGWRMPVDFKYRGIATGEFITGALLFGSLAVLA